MSGVALQQVPGGPIAAHLESVAERALDAKLAESFRLGALTTPITAIAAAVLLVNSFGWKSWIIVWMATMFLAGLGQAFAYRRHTGDGGWRRIAIGSQLLSGFAWGLVPLGALPDETVGQSLMLAGLLGVLASSIPFAAAVRSAAFAFLLSLGATSSVAFLVNTTGSMRYAAVLMILSALFYMVLAGTVHRTFREAALLTAELEHRADTDPLTGTRNRRSFARELQAQLDAEADVAVAFLDLDGFKGVNDSFGHDAGDELLVLVSQRLSAIASPRTVGRIGGDEFMVLSDSDEEPANFGERILAQFDEPFELSETTVHLGCSVGVATSNVVEVDIRDGRELAPALVNAADMAQLAGKRAGGSRVVVAVPQTLQP